MQLMNPGMKGKSVIDLDAFIRTKMEKLKGVTPKQAIYICELSEVEPRDILTTKWLSVRFGKVFYTPKESRPHNQLARYFSKNILQSLMKKSLEWSYFPGAIPIVNVFQCGVAQSKFPDITVGKANVCTYPIVGEVGFAHENLNQLFIEVAQLLSEFTFSVYGLALDLSCNKNNFYVDFYLFKRVSPFNCEKVDWLNGLLTHGNINTEVCEKIGDEKSSQELFDKLKIQLIFHIKITNANISEGLEFKLEADANFGFEDEVAMTIPAEDLKKIRSCWLEHFRNLESR